MERTSVDFGLVARKIGDIFGLKSSSKDEVWRSLYMCVGTV